MTSIWNPNITARTDAYFVVADITARDSFLTGNRFEGMRIYVQSVDLSYVLNADLATWSLAPEDGANIRARAGFTYGGTWSSGMSLTQGYLYTGPDNLDYIALVSGTASGTMPSANKTQFRRIGQKKVVRLSEFAAALDGTTDDTAPFRAFLKSLGPSIVGIIDGPVRITNADGNTASITGMPDSSVPVAAEILTQCEVICIDGAYVWYDYTDDGSTTKYGIRVYADDVALTGLWLKGNLTSASITTAASAPEGNRICALRAVKPDSSVLKRFRVNGGIIQNLNYVFGYNHSCPKIEGVAFLDTFQGVQIDISTGARVQDNFFQGIRSTPLASAFNDDQIALFGATNFKVSNNIIDKNGQSGDAYGLAHGILVGRINSPTAGVSRGKVKGNIVVNLRNSTQEASGNPTDYATANAAIAVLSTDSYAITDVDVDGNIIYNCVHGIQIGNNIVHGVYPSNVHTRIRVRGNIVNSLRTAFYAEAVDRLYVEASNTFHVTGSTPLYAAYLYFCTNYRFSGNDVLNDTAFSSASGLIFDIGTNGEVCGNTINGSCSAADWYVNCSSQNGWKYDGNTYNGNKHLKITKNGSYVNANISGKGNKVTASGAAGAFGQFGTYTDGTLTIEPSLFTDNWLNGRFCYAYHFAEMVGQKSSLPSSGTYQIGDTWINYQTSLTSPIRRWVCTNASPLTWQPTEWMVGKSTTANRPTLGANDIGVEYYDTTTGGFVRWNGSSWV